LHTASRRPLAAGTARTGDKRHSSLLVGMTWLLMTLMILPKNFVSLVFPDPPPLAAESTGLALNWCLWLFLLLASPLLVSSRMAAARAIIPYLNRYFIVFLGLALVSVTWSAAPGLTLERFRRFFILDCFSLAFVIYAWQPRRFQQALRPIILILLVASIVQGIFLPELAITQSDASELKNAWHGVTQHKNILGSLATLGVIFYFHGWLSRELRPAQAAPGLGISLLSLALSRSSTSLLAAAFSIFLLLLLLRSSPGIRRYMPYIIGFFVMLVGLYALVALGFLPILHNLMDPISAATGKQAGTATGRTPIWALIKAEITRHPWFGIGYGAYWVGPIAGTASYVFVTQLYFYPLSAHNGYLEVTNDLGYAGLACLVGYIFVYTRDCLRLWKLDRQQAALFLALLFQQALENLSEAEWMQVAAFNCAVMALATFALARALFDAKLRAAPLHRGR
jgi:exopolysaccharide production protein ExoQ